jgi:hypothetical protein
MQSGPGSDEVSKKDDSAKSSDAEAPRAGSDAASGAAAGAAAVPPPVTPPTTSATAAPAAASTTSPSKTSIVTPAAATTPPPPPVPTAIKAEDLEKVEKGITALRKNIQSLHTAAARNPSAGQARKYLAHNRLGYWDTKLANSLDTIQAKLIAKASTETEKAAIKSSMTELHSKMQMQNASLVSDGKFDAKKSSEASRDAFSTAINGIKNAAKTAELKELEDLKETGLKKLIEDQSNAAKRAKDEAFSAAYQAQIKALYPAGSWKHESEVDNSPEAKIAAGTTTFSEAKSGIYRSRLLDSLSILVQVTDTGFQVSADFSSYEEMGVGMGEMIDLMIEKGRTPIELCFPDVTRASIRGLEIMVNEITDPNKHPREAIVTIDPRITFHNEADRKLLLALKERLQKHNTDFQNRESKHEEKGKQLAENSPDAGAIAKTENTKRIEKETKALGGIYDAAGDLEAAKQTKMDGKYVSQFESAFKEFERQRVMPDASKAPDSKLAKLDEQLEKAQEKTHARLAEQATKGPTDEVKAEAKTTLAKLEGLQVKQDRIALDDLKRSLESARKEHTGLKVTYESSPDAALKAEMVKKATEIVKLATQLQRKLDNVEQRLQARATSGATDELKQAATDALKTATGLKKEVEIERTEAAKTDFGKETKFMQAPPPDQKTPAPDEQKDEGSSLRVK